MKRHEGVSKDDAKALSVGIDLESCSDRNLLLVYKEELWSLSSGKKAGFSASVSRRFRKMGILKIHELTLTEKGKKLLDEA